MNTVVRWVCWTPRRAIRTTASVVTLLALLGMAGVAHSVSTVRARAAHQPAVTATMQPTMRPTVPSASPTLDAVPARDPGAALATTFVRVWGSARAHRHDTWLAQVASLTTPQLAENLAGVPATKIPAVAPLGAPRVVSASSDGTTYAVDTAAGRYLVTVEAGVTSPVVADFRTP